MENQILAKSLAPRTPNLLTIGVCEMSGAFINSAATQPNILLSSEYLLMFPAKSQRHPFAGGIYF